MRPHWLSPDAPPEFFPPVHNALHEPNGLLAIGGDLSPPRLLAAYRQGIFPWYSEDQPILWWSPDPRAVLRPERIHVSRSLGKRLRRNDFEISVDRAFAQVMDACAEPRNGQDGTWITAEMMGAYRHLHALGHAHSVECWAEGRLVGGLYGVAIGRVFFGESMFSRASDASKVALCALCEMPYALIDCQLPTDHLASMGAELIARERFVALLSELCAPGPPRARLR